jgi:Mrp family chromosome partitioning ATPase
MMSLQEATFCALTMKLFALLRDDEPSAKGKILVVTSARAQEGKTFIASTLARTMAALDDEPIALVDANVQAPTLHTLFDVDGSRGFSDCLVTGSLTVPMLAGQVENLSILPIGGHPKPGTVFKTHRIVKVFDELRDRYRVTVIDTGVLNAAGALPHLADGVLLVIDSSKTRREVIQGVLAQTNVAPKKILGAILNRQQQYIPSMFYNSL